MNLSQLVNAIAVQSGWPMRTDANGEIRVEVATQNGRTQVVTLAQGNDPEGTPVIYLWSVAGHISAARDLQALMRFSVRLSYGCTALKDDKIIVKHSLCMHGDVQQALRKAIFFVGRAADNLEAEAYGAADNH